MEAIDLQNHKHKFKFVSVQYNVPLYRRFKNVGGAMYHFICVYCYQNLEVTRWDMLAMWRDGIFRIKAKGEIDLNVELRPLSPQEKTRFHIDKVRDTKRVERKPR